METKKEIYLTMASEAEKHAVKTGSSELKEAWLKIAESCRKLAECGPIDVTPISQGPEV